MDRKNSYNLTVALLGMVAGILLTLLITQIVSSRQVRVSGREWSKLNVVLNTVSRDYVDSIDYKSVTEDVLAEALSMLDPHSLYFPPVEFKAVEEDLAGNFEGIGIQFNVPNDTAIVLDVIPGGPAEKVGMMKGDRILKVDTVGIAGVKYPQDSMVRRMKGPAGTKVAIHVNRDGVDIPFTIVRGKIPVNSIDAAFMLNPQTGYIRLSKFAATTGKEFLQESTSLQKQGMKNLILDLRDNSGGYLDQAIILSDLFLSEGRTIVYTEGLHSPRQDYKADGKGNLKDVGLSVLINENSASSSEILAGAIQDNDRGVIIGRRSFGKGLVQKSINFSDGSGMRLTVARFHTPSGRCIQKPYGEDYSYDVYKRYVDGELVDADSIKVNKNDSYKTVGGRTVYGGGGIIPDVFVPMDTTKVTSFYLQLSRKATLMRFASAYFDAHKKELSEIDDFDVLDAYLDKAGLDRKLISYALVQDGIKLSSQAEWEQSQPYLMTQVRALVGRYSKLGDKAFYRIHSAIDTTIQEALKPHSID